MKIEDFLKLSLSQRVEIAKQPKDLRKDPFWLERLKTAVETKSPLAVFFSKELTEVYWNIIEN